MATQTISTEWRDMDVTTTFEAREVDDDYGVPGSPRWTAYEDPTAIEWEIDGIGYTPKAAERAFGKVAIDSLENELCERLDADRWESEEPPEREYEDME